MGVVVSGVLALVLAGAPAAVARPALVRADAEARPGPSPRRLFNMGLVAEQRGDGLTAVARYMAARLAPRTSFADDLYARGAGLRLLRLLAGRDDDAAAAVAAALASDGSAKPGTDLSPLVRSLLRRLEREFLVVEGIIEGVKLDAEGGTRLVIRDGAGAEHVIRAPAPVGPFTAGDAVRVVARRHLEGEATLVALGHTESDAWRLMAVRGLAAAGAALGAL